MKGTIKTMMYELEVRNNSSYTTENVRMWSNNIQTLAFALMDVYPTLNWTILSIKAIEDEPCEPLRYGTIALIKQLRTEHGLSLTIAKSITDAAKEHGSFKMPFKVVKYDKNYDKPYTYEPKTYQD